jgi:alkylated DNA repair dioxygenase AlkB
MYRGFEALVLDGGGLFYTGALPDTLRVDEAGFEALWALHPEGFHEIMMHGRKVETPRWQQAYGHDYRYTGNTNRALPIDPLMAPLLAWCQEAVDARLNGLLFNWYDGARGHYIGAHRDSTIGLVEGTPVVTISLGEARPWRLRPWKGKGFEDVEATEGGVFILPWETNQRYTHEVTAPARATGRRISITARAFEG